ncbi:extracellular solute-binding protein [Streptomyces sp. V3I7]|uniref:extracellular solute-binding protein n=1 Tax=Streptomyces sp. V3I7 TaxID=3042278 RepID=UPI0027D7C707|nr:extracellular solute-binding protein [Streptomyces sp. V3I7]
MIAAVSALGMTVGLTGCGSADASSDVTLRLVAADYGDSPANSTRKYWDHLAREYQAKHPGVTVDVSVYSWNEVDRKVREMVDAGEAPDLAQIGSYADYAATGKLYPVSDLLSIPVQADFLPQLAAAGEVDHAQYGLPFAASTRVLFYNKSLFSKAGITPPTDWNDLAADAEALKGQGVPYPYALPLGPEEAQAETLQWLLGGGSPGYTNDIGTYAIDAPQNVRTLTWLKDNLVGKGLTGPVAPGELNRADAFAAFAKGQVGMIDGHPGLMRQAAAHGVKFGTVPMPGRTGKAAATLGVCDWMMAFKQEDDHTAQVGDFLDFVYSEKNVLDFSRRSGLLPVTIAGSDAMSVAPQDKALRPFLDQLSIAAFYPAGKTSWADTSAEIKKNIGRAVGPKAGPAAVLSDLQADASAADSRSRGASAPAS